MKPSAHVVEYVGRWVVADGEISGDDICKQIEWLTTHHLRKLAISEQSGGWETLFRDPDDGRHWERTYPEGELQGGRLPRLAVLTGPQAQTKYRFG